MYLLLWNVVRCIYFDLLVFTWTLHFIICPDPTHTRAFNNKRYFEDMLIKQGEDINSDDGQRPAVKRVVDEYRQSKEFQTYEALCRGETTQVWQLSFLKNKQSHKSWSDEMLETSLILEPVFVRPLPFSFPLLIYLYHLWKEVPPQ